MIRKRVEFDKEVSRSGVLSGSGGGLHVHVLEHNST